MNTTDNHLIKQTIAGDQKSFGVLIDRYQDYVFSVCLKVLQQRHLAEEAAQDALVKAYHKLPTFRKESQFSTWLYTLAYRTALDKLKQRKRNVSSLDDSSSFIQPEATGSRADRRLEEYDQKELIAKLIAKLPVTDRLIISLHYLQEQPVKAIAKIMDMTVTNVKTRLFRSREQLRKLVRKNQLDQTVFHIED